MCGQTHHQTKLRFVLPPMISHQKHHWVASDFHRPATCQSRRTCSQDEIDFCKKVQTHNFLCIQGDSHCLPVASLEFLGGVVLQKPTKKQLALCFLFLLAFWQPEAFLPCTLAVVSCSSSFQLCRKTSVHLFMYFSFWSRNDWKQQHSPSLVERKLSALRISICWSVQNAQARTPYQTPA